MFSAVLGLFSQDLAVDLGTCTTRIHQRGCGIICREPTVVAVHTDGRSRRRVVAVGAPARDMLGRTPSDILAVRPVRDGQIDDFDVTEALLVHLVRQIHGRNAWMSPRMVIAVPHGATDMELRAVRESCESAGARDVQLIPRPLAAAIGADLPVSKASGHMVIDLGGGATDVSILSLNGVVSCISVRGGGDGMDAEIIRTLRDDHDLLIGAPTARALRESLTHEDRVHRVSGRCLRGHVPRTAGVRSSEVRSAIAPCIEAVATAIRRTVEAAAPELAHDVVDNGAVLTGGGSRLDGLADALRDATGLAIVVAEDPEDATVRGAGRVLEELDLLRRVAC